MKKVEASCCVGGMSSATLWPHRIGGSRGWALAPDVFARVEVLGSYWSGVLTAALPEGAVTHLDRGTRSRPMVAAMLGRRGLHCIWIEEPKKTWGGIFESERRTPLLCARVGGAAAQADRRMQERQCQGKKRLEVEWGLGIQFFTLCLLSFSLDQILVCHCTFKAPWGPVGGDLNPPSSPAKVGAPSQHTQGGKSSLVPTPLARVPDGDLVRTEKITLSRKKSGNRPICKSIDTRIN